MRKGKLGVFNPLGLVSLVAGRKASSPVKLPASPPGELVYTGEGAAEGVVISIVEYDPAGVEEVEIESVEDCRRFAKTEAVTWVRVTGLNEVEKIDLLGKEFGIHPLVLEDILHVHSRAKVEEFDDYVFVVAKLLSFDVEREELEVQHFAMVLLEGGVLTFQDQSTELFDPLLARIRNGKGRIRGARADYLAWAVMDVVVDNYFAVIDKVDAALTELDERMQENVIGVDAKHLYTMKRELAELGRLVRPIREIVTVLQRGESELMTESSRPFFRDLYDHAIYVIERIDELRDIGSSLRDYYMASVGNRMNEIMKVLTIFASFFLPLTFLAGIYGMNFEHMPELAWRWAYPALWGLFVFVSLGMFWYFRRKGWF